MQTRAEKIVDWLRKVYGERPAIIAVSGGVDSALALTLLVKALGAKRVIPICLPYHKQDMRDAKRIIEWNKVEEKMVEVNIGEMVDLLVQQLGIGETIRKGNVMARVRMMIVFDWAKKMQGLVCGTENRSEHELGYYTRFGDAASDVEPITGLYKTEVWEMAKELGLPDVFYTKEPSAGLWEGQTDEREMGFSYREADLVLQGKLEGMNQEIIEKVQRVVTNNKFKLEVPYMFG